MDVADSIVCGVDPSPAGREALRQALRLHSPGGRLLALTAFDPGLAGHGGSHAARRFEREALAARDEAAQALRGLPGTEARLVTGTPVRCLVEAAAAEDATLLVVGTHRFRRRVDLVVGSVANRVLHEAPCSVLTCRPVADADAFPRSVVVGVDGSDGAQEAAAAGHALAHRLGARLEILVAQGGKRVDIEGLWRLPTLAWDGRRPADALVAASRRADLLVVGACGLHGPGTLGSVGEAVVAHAHCSVLVVRPLAVALDRQEATVLASAG